MRIFPIQKGKIVFSTFEGDGGFCCNPKYIAEELHNSGKQYKMVWLTKNMNKDFPEYVKKKKYSILNLAYHLSTAQVWIDNYRKPYGTLKRKNQLYIQTWHASIGFKAVGLFRGKKFPEIARIVSEWDSNLADYILSNSDYCDNVYPQKLLYNGPTLRSGSPRCDCLINNLEKGKFEIHEKYGIPLDAKVFMYAPTFRGGNQKGQDKKVNCDYPSVDFKRLTNELQKIDGCEWYIFVRLHPQLSNKIGQMPVLSHVDKYIDVSPVDDISELLCATDLLITDYSSCAFDALYAHIPVLLYADDINAYKENRGEFMWNEDELPFKVAENNDELINNLINFNYKQYIKKADEFMQKYNIVEDGRASKKVVKEIETYVEKM